MKTKGERRIEILKDVLKQLKLNRYNATQGSYVGLPRELYILKSENPEASAQKVLLSTIKPCKVCAKGGIFLSTIRKENKVQICDLGWEENDDTHEATNRVKNLFGKRNLDKIEAAFEKWTYVNSSNEYYKEERGLFADQTQVKDEKLSKFVKRYPNKTKRLEAIIRNAIKNNGIFKP